MPRLSLPANRELGGRSAGTIDAIDLRGAVDLCTSVLARFRQRHEDAAERAVSAWSLIRPCARVISRYLTLARVPVYNGFTRLEGQHGRGPLSREAVVESRLQIPQDYGLGLAVEGVIPRLVQPTAAVFRLNNCVCHLTQRSRSASSGSEPSESDWAMINEGAKAASSC